MKYISIIALIVAGILTSTANAVVYTREFFEEQGIISRKAPDNTVNAINMLLETNSVTDREARVTIKASRTLVSKKNQMTGAETLSIVNTIISVAPKDRMWVSVYASNILAGNLEYVPDATPDGLARLAILHAKARRAAGAPGEEAYKMGIVFHKAPGEVVIRRGGKDHVVNPDQYPQLMESLGVRDIKDVDRRFTEFKP